MIEQFEIEVGPFSKGLHLITSQIKELLKQSKIDRGLCNIFCLHTSCSLTITENADPSVRRDLMVAFESLAPESEEWEHSAEGPDDMPAHVKSSLTDSSLTLPWKDCGLVLGAWQGVCLCEHRNRAVSRKLFITLIGS